MIEIHKASDRGQADYGWLKTHYSFSFATYYNPQRMGFGKLRVLNDDVVAAGKGFGMHGHDSMEIITIVLSGSLEHKDSMGNHGIIHAGEVQRISAGSGISHSEFNHSKESSVHLLQIWVEPKEEDIEPSYEQKSFGEQKSNVLVPLVLGKKSKDALYMHQDGGFYLAKMNNSKSVSFPLPKNHGAYVFVISGAIHIGAAKLGQRDAAAISHESQVVLIAAAESQILLIEVPL